METSHYESKQQARQQRYLERAEKARQQASAARKAADDAVAGIPPGQPILVGHHSESRHRNALKRSDNQMRKAFALHDKAEYYERKAAGVGKGGIFSDDPDAIEKLETKIERAESAQVFMREMNKVIRKYKGKPEAVTRLIERAKELDVPSFGEVQARELLQPDFCGRIGFPNYALTNNNANIRRMRQRIEELKKRERMEVREVQYDGFTILHNVEENRVQLCFDAIPSQEIRTLLKSRGFRWSRTHQAWQRHLNNAGTWAAECVAKEINKRNGE